ncbi:MAG: peptidoglycan-binding domain-containing protein [Shimia sp.]
MRVLLPVLLCLAAPAASEGLPLPDGRYATEPRFCAFTEADMLGLGDAVSLSIRTLRGAVIDGHYETVCRAEAVRALGDDLLFDRVCSAEGEEWRERTVWVRVGRDGFRDGDRTFRLCAGDGAALTDGDAIHSAQVSLRRLGFAPGAIDGAMGPRTLAAINAFQRARGLPVTAFLDRATATRLIDEEMAILEE